MKKFILFSIILGALSSTVISCGSPPEKEKSSASTSPTEGVTNDAGLYLNVSTNWESGTVKETHGTCNVNYLAPGTSVTCNISVPEGQLYYSDVNFTIGTKFPEMCAMITFAPYYYQIADNDTDYTPPGADEPAKCGTELNSTLACWGGAAPQIVTSFPKNTGRYFLPAIGAETTFKLPAENTVRWYNLNPTAPYIKNFLSVNNMPSGSRNTARAGEYVAGTMHDYSISCLDLWYHPVFSIKLILDDEDTQSTQGVQDEVEDWET